MNAIKALLGAAALVAGMGAGPLAAQDPQNQQPSMSAGGMSRLQVDGKITDVDKGTNQMVIETKDIPGHTGAVLKLVYTVTDIAQFEKFKDGDKVVVDVIVTDKGPTAEAIYMPDEVPGRVEGGVGVSGGVNVTPNPNPSDPNAGVSGNVTGGVTTDTTQAGVSAGVSAGVQANPPTTYPANPPSYDPNQPSTTTPPTADTTSKNPDPSPSAGSGMDSASRAERDAMKSEGKDVTVAGKDISADVDIKDTDKNPESSSQKDVTILGKDVHVDGAVKDDKKPDAPSEPTYDANNDPTKAGTAHPADKRTPFTGKISSLNEGARQLTIATEDIPGNPGGQTLPYTVPAAENFASFHEGDMVTGDLVVSDNRTFIENVKLSTDKAKTSKKKTSAKTTPPGTQHPAELQKP